MNVGIDLGTTNSAVAFIHPQEAEDADFPPIRLLDIPQFVAEGVQASQKTLPSFLYLGDREYVGVYAREQGALVPTRLIHSAKSWLVNAAVDRTANILPWDAQEVGRVLSPVEVSARYLAHMREAWNQSGQPRLEQQDVVLTVPASFDEEARELTVQAARQAGLERLALLEEPAAAFYAWIANHLAESRQRLVDGQLVLVIDVGGGTSDFTLIRVSREGDRVDFTRTAVGKHLLLGGDNLDLTLAWLAETKLGTPLSLRQRSALRRQCCAAKEELLTNPEKASYEITVLGAGSGLVSGTRRTSVLRDEALALALDGFLPFCDPGAKPKEEKRSLFRELGLPYVSDAAVTRHLAEFLTGAGAEAASGPDTILFNGGFFMPEVCRRRVADVLERWYGRRPFILENRDLHLAVAVGAAYYSYARVSGSGILVRGGLPRSYYIEIGAAGLESAADRLRTVCLVPRGTETGTTLELDLPQLELVANRPVSFRLFSSLTRAGDALGEIVEFDPASLQRDDLHAHAPLQALIRFGKRTEERAVPVKLGVSLTEIGTMDLWCDSKVSDHRWRLEFRLRKGVAEAEPATRPRAATVVSDSALGDARRAIQETFKPGAPVAPEELPARLEQALGLGKNAWPLACLRQLSDLTLDLSDRRSLSPALEARWLNLCGFCLRPGFGFPGDELRIEKSRRIYAAGLAFPNQIQCQIDWWIFWGRVAGGLSRNQQVELFQRIAGVLLPRGKKPPRTHPGLRREVWRTAASLELLPLQTKGELGNELIRLVRTGEARESELWCLSRLGARELLYGPANQVLQQSIVSGWVRELAGRPGAEEHVAIMARCTGDAARDLPPATVELVRRVLDASPHRDRLVRILDGEEPLDARTRDRIFGEELPSGLIFRE